MRDISDYEKQYVVRDFEIYKVEYRRKLILNFVQKYNPQSILEIGCGMEPLFKYLEKPIKDYVFVEPSEQFYKNAMEIAKYSKQQLGGGEANKRI